MTTDDGLSIHIPDLGNPYRAMIEGFLSRAFPANLSNQGNVLDALTAAFVATSKTRFGPAPNPESLVAIRSVLRKVIESGQPVPVLVPWGSKKPDNSARLDVAELGGLKTLSQLQERVVRFHAPGLAVNLRIEDVGGFYLFADEGQAARDAGIRYTEDMVKLVRVLGLDFITTRRESDMMGEHIYTQTAEVLRPLLVEYLTETDAYGLAGHEQLQSWKELAGLGWTGEIPMEQRDYYRQRYAALYPKSTPREQTDRLARYFAGSLARYKLHATGAAPEWGRDFLQLNFAPPAPGTPPSIGDRRLYYRTLPETMTRTHLPPWRAKGYLKIEGETVTPKISGWTEAGWLTLDPCEAVFSRAGESVAVQADQLVVEG